MLGINQFYDYVSLLLNYALCILLVNNVKRPDSVLYSSSSINATSGF